MTDENTPSTDDSRPAVGGPVERGVRPGSGARRLAEAIDPLRRKAAPDHLTVGCAAQMLEAQAAEIERLRADAAAMRDLLNRAQTAVCVANRTLVLDDMPGQIAELLHRTAYLKA